MTGGMLIRCSPGSNTREPTTAHVVLPKVSKPLPVDGGLDRYGTKYLAPRSLFCLHRKEPVMNRIVYIVGLVVIVIAVLSFFGLR